MTIIEDYYQRILDSKCPAAIRKQLVEFYRAIPPDVEIKIIALRPPQAQFD
jgi:hypothetical protein